MIKEEGHAISVIILYNFGVCDEKRVAISVIILYTFGVCDEKESRIISLLDANVCMKHQIREFNGFPKFELFPKSPRNLLYVFLFHDHLYWTCAL